MEVSFSQILSILAYSVIGIISYFIARTIKSIDENQKSMCEELKNIALKVAQLEAEHKIYTHHTQFSQFLKR